jgi:hypothetical protein
VAIPWSDLSGLLLVLSGQGWDGIRSGRFGRFGDTSCSWCSTCKLLSTIDVYSQMNDILFSLSLSLLF